MDESAPITWLINQINNIVSGGAGAAASAISGVVTPIASVCFGIYMIFVCINYLRGVETEPVLDFGLRMISVAIILGLGLNASNYQHYVMPIVTNIGMDVANAIGGGTSTANLLDQLALFYIDIMSGGYDSVQALTFPFNLGPLFLYIFKCICVLIGLVPFLVVATVYIVIANVGAYLIAMVGPLFFALLLFPATRQYFSAWLNSAFSFALIPIFVAVIATISINLSKMMLSSGGGGTLDDASLKAVFLATLGNLTLLIVVRYVSALASSLSAGGINVGTVRGVGALASGIRNFGAGTVREIRGAYQTGKAFSAWRATRRPQSGQIRRAG